MRRTKRSRPCAGVISDGIPGIVTWNVGYMRGLFPKLDVLTPGRSRQGVQRRGEADASGGGCGSAERKRMAVSRLTTLLSTL